MSDLYVEHSRFVRSLVWLYRVAPSDRDDVAQDVWLVAHRRARALRPSASPRAWLAAIVRRCVADRRRARARRPVALVDREEIDQIAAGAPALERWYEVLDFVESAVPDDVTREAYLLSVVDFTAREIAEITGAPATTVEWRLKVARSALVQHQAREQRAGAAMPVFSLGALVEALRPPVETPANDVPPPWGRSPMRPSPRWLFRALGAVACSAAGFVAGVLLSAPSAAPAAAPAPMLVAVELPPPPPSSTSAPVPPVTSSWSTLASTAAPPPSASSPARPATSSSSAPAPASSAAAREAEAADVLLMHARAALGGAPAEALGLTEEHARRWPQRNALEREVIAVRALARIGRREEATQRARAVVERSPAYRGALETAVGPLP